MARFVEKVVVPMMLMAMLIALAEATPPGIAKNPSHARCLIKKYKHCYNLEHVCPKFCPDSCTVECVSCKPICTDGSTPPPEDNPTPSPSPYPPTPPATTPTPSPPPPPTPTPPSPPTPTPSPPTPTPTTPSPSSSPTPSPPAPTPSPPTPTPSTPSTPSSPTPTPSPPTPTPSTPSPPSSPTPSPRTSPSPSTPSTSPKTAKCKNRYYTECYNTEHTCPSSCPGGCEVDCVTCKPVCNCDRPGAVCQDPRFIGGDGVTFYFHGKKDHDFCLVSEPNFHINAHFIGKRNEKMTRDFTWVQSIAILFGNHQIFIGALKTSTWDDSVDRFALSYDGEPLTLLETEGSEWQSENEPGVSITRTSNNNGVIVEVEGNFKITAKVVPITKEDSRIHNYGITEDDCFAHLELGFKFFSLSDVVTGVLGQTYRPGYLRRVDVGAKMPVIGGDKEFQTSGLFAADCAVARFDAGNGFSKNGYLQGFELPGLSCASGIDGQGVVCKR